VKSCHLLALPASSLKSLTPRLLSAAQAPRHRTQTGTHRCLRHMLNLAVKWGKLKRNPISSEQFYGEDCTREYVLSAEEESRLLAASPVSLKPIIGLALSTGMRKSQILNLRWNQVNLARGIVSLPAQANKDKKPHVLPLNETARAILSAQPWQGEYVFGGEKPRRTIQKAFKKALGKAGLYEGIRFHDLRHTFGTRLAVCGCDSATLKELMRHGSLQMTQRYLHPCQDAMERAVKLLDSHKMVTFSGGPVQEKRVAVAGSDAGTNWLHVSNERKKEEPAVGFEPTTAALRMRCSTTELPGLVLSRRQRH